MSYESPIKLITDFEYKIKKEVKENVVKAVCSYAIDTDKDELFKLLLNDRKQYDKGYADGKIDAVEHGHWAETWKGNWHCCSICNRPPLVDGRDDDVLSPYCPWCGAKMDEEAQP